MADRTLVSFSGGRTSGLMSYALKQKPGALGVRKYSDGSGYNFARHRTAIPTRNEGSPDERGAK